MKASYFLGKGSFEVRQAPELHPGPGEVVIKNMVCGVCGTDVHIFHGEPGSADVNPPVVLGHEYSGESNACVPASASVPFTAPNAIPIKIIPAQI